MDETNSYRLFLDLDRLSEVEAVFTFRDQNDEGELINRHVAAISRNIWERQGKPMRILIVVPENKEVF